MVATFVIVGHKACLERPALGTAHIRNQQLVRIKPKITQFELLHICCKSGQRPSLPLLLHQVCQLRVTHSPVTMSLAVVNVGLGSVLGLFFSFR